MKNDEFDIIADYFQNQYYLAYEEVLKKIGKRIKDVGHMSASDAHALQQVTAYGADIQEIDAILKKQAEKSQEEMQKVYEEIANNGYEFAAKFYDAKGVLQVPISENIPLQNTLTALLKTGSELMQNFGNTSSLGVVNRRGVFVPFREHYVRMIDDAVLLVSTGVKDYNSAISSTVKELLNSGIRVKYESGYTRDIYSAVRMNILDGCNQVWLKTQEECGKQYGSDGFEISAHGLCAPDHIDIQGRQFTKEQYNRLNSTLQRPIGKMNCRHFAFPIVIGVSPPTYTEEELKQVNNLSNAIVSSGNWSGTRYEASQVMRRYESRIRQQKAQSAFFGAMGDDAQKAIANKKVRQLSSEYRAFCANTGLTQRRNRTSMPKI